MFDRYFPSMRGWARPSRWRRSPQRVSVQWENELGAGLILSPRNFLGTAANLSRGENQCARVYAALDRGEAERYAALADAELAGIADPDDREVIAGQLAELGL